MATVKNHFLLPLQRADGSVVAIGAGVFVDGQFELSYHSDGVVALNVIPSKGLAERYEFGPIEFSGNGVVAYVIAWEIGGVAKLAMNETLIPLRNDEENSLVISIAAVPRTPHVPALFEADVFPYNLADRREQYFVLTICDLVTRINSGSEYDLSRTSLLIRQLFIDKTRLFDVVNKKYRTKLKVCVSKRSVECCGNRQVMDGILSSFQAVNPYPQYIESEVLWISRDKFFGLKILYGNGRWYSVIDVINYVAYHGGGVHFFDDGVPGAQSGHEIAGHEMNIPMSLYLGICMCLIEGVTELLVEIDSAVPFLTFRGAGFVISEGL